MFHPSELKGTENNTETGIIPLITLISHMHNPTLSDWFPSETTPSSEFRAEGLMPIKVEGRAGVFHQTDRDEAIHSLGGGRENADVGQHTTWTANGENVSLKTQT